MQSTFQEYCESVGIIQLTTCGHIPQQNGIIECKNRYLLDIARVIMIHMHVPKHFWGGALLSVLSF